MGFQPKHFFNPIFFHAVRVKRQIPEYMHIHCDSVTHMILKFAVLGRRAGVEPWWNKHMDLSSNLF